MTTLVELKNRKAELQEEMQANRKAGIINDEEILDEYMAICDRLENAESKLLTRIT